MSSTNWKKKICLIPFISTIIILFATMYILMSRKASLKIWAKFHLTFFLTGSALSIMNSLIAKTNAPILNIIITILVLTAANFCFINLQRYSKAHEAEEKTVEIKIQKVVIIMAVICTVLSIIATSIFFAEDSPDYVDTNGEDNTSLVHITVDEIVSTTGDYVAINAALSNDGGQTLVPASLDSTDYDTVVFHCKQIDGVLTLQTTKVHENTVTLNIDSEIKSGNMEMIILVDGKYFSHIATGSHQTVELNDVAEKTIIVRMAAESAEVNITVMRDYQ